MNRKLLYLPFFLALTLTLVNVAQAVEGDDINLGTFDDALAERFGISVFAGGILATTILAMMFILPIALYSKTLMPPIIVGFLVLGFSIAVGWIGYFFIVIIAFIVALMFGDKMRNWIAG